MCDSWGKTLKLGPVPWKGGFSRRQNSTLLSSQLLNWPPARSTRRCLCGLFHDKSSPGSFGNVGFVWEAGEPACLMRSLFLELLPCWTWPEWAAGMPWNHVCLWNIKSLPSYARAGQRPACLWTQILHISSVLSSGDLCLFSALEQKGWNPVESGGARVSMLPWGLWAPGPICFVGSIWGVILLVGNVGRRPGQHLAVSGKRCLNSQWSQRSGQCLHFLPGSHSRWPALAWPDKWPPRAVDTHPTRGRVGVGVEGREQVAWGPRQPGACQLLPGLALKSGSRLWKHFYSGPLTSSSALPPVLSFLSHFFPLPALLLSQWSGLSPYHMVGKQFPIHKVLL